MPRLRRRKRAQFKRPQLYVEQILEWADAYFARHGRWPNINSGRIPQTMDDTWARIDDGLRGGHRGLPKDSGWSLARLLNEFRGVRNSEYPPPLTESVAFKWAKAHRRRHGTWPTDRSGPIVDAPGETWLAVDLALRRGRRGLPGGSSLARLLAKYGARRNLAAVPRLTVKQILAWADAHHRRTGQWPRRTSGAIADAPDETWAAINAALKHGRRGLTGGSTLPRLLAEKRGVRKRAMRTELSPRQICQWARAHRHRTGESPHKRSGPVHEAPDETWGGIDHALRTGYRGLPGGSSLSQLLAEHFPQHAGAASRQPQLP
ncbi:MAG: hypothetical protein KY476_14390 [Planctomycetes bacterium]|nr:hypothetical protein [Planctomycetota bacterium]